MIHTHQLKRIVVIACKQSLTKSPSENWASRHNKGAWLLEEAAGQKADKHLHIDNPPTAGNVLKAWLVYTKANYSLSFKTHSVKTITEPYKTVEARVA